MAVSLLTTHPNGSKVSFENHEEVMLAIFVTR